MQYTIGLRTVVVVVIEGNAVKVSRAKCNTFTIEHISPVIENIDSTGTLDADWVKKYLADNYHCTLSIG
jgi:hypothetical protein